MAILCAFGSIRSLKTTNDMCLKFVNGLRPKISICWGQGVLRKISGFFVERAPTTVGITCGIYYFGPPTVFFVERITCFYPYGGNCTYDENATNGRWINCTGSYYRDMSLNTRIALGSLFAAFGAYSTAYLRWFTEPFEEGAHRLKTAAVN